MAIDQLPDLVLFELFSLLSWEEKLRLKAVCRRLNSLLTCIFNEATKRLFVHRKVISLSENWGSPDQPVRRKEFIHLQLFLKFLRIGYFRNVKSLHLFKLNVNYGDPRPIFEEDSRKLLFNCLAKLDELFVTNEGQLSDIFDSDEFALVEGDTKRIDLPDLKSLSIKYSLASPSKVLRINSQRLERLVFWARDERAIALSNPEKIGYIECRHFAESVFQGKRFPNLRHLSCLSIANNFDLSEYPKLRKLDVCPSKEQFENRLHIVKRLLEQKETLGRSDLEITVFGFQGLTPVALERKNESDGSIQLKLDELTNNFSRFVGSLPWSTSAIITPAVEEDLGSLPGFIRRLSINWVTLSGDPNPVLAIQFLKEINGVRTLTISDCSYSNEFYDQLGSVPCIQCLGFTDSQMSAVTSYDFIATIRFLRAIYARNCFPSLEDLGEAIEKCEVVHVNLANKGMIWRKRLSFRAQVQSDQPFEVSFRHYSSYYESWKEAVAFVRKCGWVIQQPMLNNGLYYPFVKIEAELRDPN